MEQDSGNGGSVLDVVRKVLRPASTTEATGAGAAPAPVVERVQPAGRDEAKIALERHVELMGQQMQQMQQRIRELEGEREVNAPVVRVDVEKCSGCGSCVDICPNDAIELVEGRAVIAAEACAGCGVCVDECPNEALALNG